MSRDKNGKLVFRLGGEFQEVFEDDDLITQDKPGYKKRVQVSISSWERRKSYKAPIPKPRRPSQEIPQEKKRRSSSLSSRSSSLMGRKRRRSRRRSSSDSRDPDATPADTSGTALEMTPSQKIAFTKEYGSSVDPDEWPPIEEEEEEEKGEPLMDDNFIDALIREGRLFSTVEFQERRVAAILGKCPGQYAYPDGLGYTGDVYSASAARGNNLRVFVDCDGQKWTGGPLLGDEDDDEDEEEGRGEGGKTRKSIAKKNMKSRNESTASTEKSKHESNTTQIIICEEPPTHVHFEDPSKRNMSKKETDEKKGIYRSTEEGHNFNDYEHKDKSTLDLELLKSCKCDSTNIGGIKNKVDVEKQQQKLKSQLSARSPHQLIKNCCRPAKTCPAPNPELSGYDAAWVQAQLRRKNNKNHSHHSNGVKMDPFLKACPTLVLEAARPKRVTCRDHVPSRRKEKELIKALQSIAPEGYMAVT